MGEMMESTGGSARFVREVGAARGRYHRENQPALPWGWWQGNPRYGIYMLRELSSVFVALWALMFLGQLQSLRQGKDAYERFLATQRRPGWILFNLIAFLFALLHSETWLQLAGVVQTVRVGERTVPPRTVTAGAFAGWGVTSLGVLVALLLFGKDENA
jgi:fumarate reductase subunit C